MDVTIIIYYDNISSILFVNNSINCQDKVHSGALSLCEKKGSNKGN